ncbi:hypothetical protein [Amycolatopsis sp. NPDC058986]|uniref:hypothetical protein n=1 Tax=unclassified Amycolatopsis TaxID=2618356 RepID=UPI00366E39DA
MAEEEECCNGSARCRQRRDCLVRVAGTVLALLGQHRLDRHGDCEYCSTGQPEAIRCTVLHTSDLLLGERTEVAWWLALGLTRRRRTLQQIRAWLAHTRAAAPST